MSDTPRTTATCNAIVSMLEPLRGGTRITEAEMNAINGVVEALANLSMELEREVAALKAERDALRVALDRAQGEIDDTNTRLMERAK